jgi:thiol-disulfide isomerase/thioredoxin
MPTRLRSPGTLSALALMIGLTAAVGIGARYFPARLLADPGREASDMAATDTLGDLPADDWLNAPGPIAGADLRGAPVLVEFWTYLCYNCKNVEPWMKRIHAQYAPRGLAVIGVHSPEFAQEREIGNVREYLRTNAITWPVAIDNNFRIWRRYNTTNAWPAFLVYNRSGELIYRGAGERAVTAAEAAIRRAVEDTTGAGQVVGADTSPGVRVQTAVRGDSLRLTLSALPGFKLVQSPPNEVWLEGARTFVPLGLPFTGTAAADVPYFIGPASITIPLHGLPPHGRVRYRVCDQRTGVCLQKDLVI